MKAVMLMMGGVTPPPVDEMASTDAANSGS